MGLFLVFYDKPQTVHENGLNPKNASPVNPKNASPGPGELWTSWVGLSCHFLRHTDGLNDVSVVFYWFFESWRTFGVFYNVVWTYLTRNICLTWRIRASHVRGVVSSSEILFFRGVHSGVFMIDRKPYSGLLFSCCVFVTFYVIRGCAFMF